MNNRIDDYYRDFIIDGLDLDAFRTAVEKVVQDCTSNIALLGITHFDNQDIVWTVETAIEQIKGMYKSNV